MTGRLEAATRATARATVVLAAGLTLLGLVWPAGSAGRSLPPSTPVTVSAPGIHLLAQVVPIGLTGGVLDPPADVRDVGWWRASARPGARHGRVVMTGHTVHAGGGALDDLGAVHRGQVIRVATTRSTVVYVVRDVRVIGHASLANLARSLFGQAGGQGQLVLVTCSGWDGVTYARNLVVTAARVTELPRTAPAGHRT